MDSRITRQGFHSLSHLAPSSCSERFLGQDNDAQARAATLYHDHKLTLTGRSPAVWPHNCEDNCPSPKIHRGLVSFYSLLFLKHHVLPNSVSLYLGCPLPRAPSSAVPDCQVNKNATASLKPLKINPSRNKSSPLLRTHLHKITYLVPYIKKQNVHIAFTCIKALDFDFSR